MPRHPDRDFTIFLAWSPTLTAVAEPDRAPDLRAVLDGLLAGWRAQASCRGEERLFLSDRKLGYEPNLGSPTVTLALLICSTCPVRRDCLAEAFREVRVELDPLSHASNRPSTSVVVDGIWAGTTYADRERVNGLPRYKAVRQLARSFPARLRRQAGAFRRRLLANARRPNYRERRVLKLLEESRVAVTRRCEGCAERLPVLARSDARYCSVRCRVAAYRTRVAA